MDDGQRDRGGLNFYRHIYPHNSRVPCRLAGRDSLRGHRRRDRGSASPEAGSANSLRHYAKPSGLNGFLAGPARRPAARYQSVAEPSRPSTTLIKERRRCSFSLKLSVALLLAAVSLLALVPLAQAASTTELLLAFVRLRRLQRPGDPERHLAGRLRERERHAKLESRRLDRLAGGGGDRRATSPTPTSSTPL